MLRIAALIALAVAAAFYFEWLPYRPVASRIEVAFAGPVSVGIDDPVEYQGLVIGRVADVRLSQSEPDEAADVVLELAIESEDVVLREGDRFHAESARLFGESKIRIEAAETSSPPLASGSRVEGVPSLDERLEEKAGEAMRQLGEAAREAGENLLESFTGRTAEKPDGNSDAEEPPESGDTPDQPRSAP